MPDASQVLVLLVVAAAAAALVAGPLVRPAAVVAAEPGATPEDDLAALALRHRIAVESLRDVEADRRAGSLDEAGYQAARSEAEERAARTLYELESAHGPRSSSAARPVRSTAWSRRIGALVGSVLIGALLVGSFLPAPLTLANRVVVNSQLAAAQRAEQARQSQIKQLQRKLTAKPDDAPGLVQLASLYLQGGSASDRQRAAQLLLLAIQIDPKQTDAYRLLITAYIQAADYADAGAATDAFAKVAPNSADVAFFRGIIAYQRAGNRVEAVRWFDAFLKAAPNDPRAVMVRSLRAEAAGRLPGSSPAPSGAP